jgi:metallo-beta-lactamase family protein
VRTVPRQAGESIERNRNFPFDPKHIEAVVLSHAHIDHCGNLPNLCQQGFSGSIYCTFATRDLASIMLEDAAEIQRADACLQEAGPDKGCRRSSRSILRPMPKRLSDSSSR